MNLRLKLSVAQEKFLKLILSKHTNFIFECGWGDMEYNQLCYIYDNGFYYNWQRDMLNSLTEDAKSSGIL